MQESPRENAVDIKLEAGTHAMEPMSFSIDGSERGASLQERVAAVRATLSDDDALLDGCNGGWGN